MNINFIRKNDNLINADFIDENILELYKDEYDGKGIFRAYNYSPDKNTISEICPEIKKYDFITVRNCIYKDDSFYFATYEEYGKSILTFSLYRSSLKYSSCKKVLQFAGNRSLLDGKNKIRIFVLNPANILVQVETFTPEDSDNLMGIINFDLTLYSTDSGEGVPVNVPDLRNNGINNIVPVSENRIMIKTGYSFIEDNRFSKLSEKEALIESIYITSLAQLIAEISLDKKAANMELVETAYLDKCITSPEIKDEFVYYTVVDIANDSADIHFVNFNTLERFTYKKIVDDWGEKTKPFVICNIPYIRTINEDSEVFLNLLEAAADMEFTEEHFICSLGKLMIFTKFRHHKERMRIYDYPGVNLICDEQYTFEAGCYRNEDYYIYF